MYIYIGAAGAPQPCCIRSDEERRWLSEGPTQSRISPIILHYTKRSLNSWLLRSRPGPLICIGRRIPLGIQPHKVTLVILHGVVSPEDTTLCRMTGVTLHTGLYPQNSGDLSTHHGGWRRRVGANIWLCLRKVDVRLPEKGHSNYHGARPVHQTISMMKWCAQVHNEAELTIAISAGAKIINVVNRDMETFQPLVRPGNTSNLYIYVYIYI